jgi:CBS domain-containing protein
MTEIATTSVTPAADVAVQPSWTAADVMSSPVTTIDASTRLSTAWTAIFRSGRRHLVVVADRRCVGVIDDRRIGLEWPMGELRATTLTVGEILRRDTTVVHTSTPVAQIARQMLDEGIDAVPVVSDHRELVGLVTGSDLIALMAYGHPRRAGAGAE